jgi:hypothetical protein
MASTGVASCHARAWILPIAIWQRQPAKPHVVARRVVFCAVDSPGHGRWWQASPDKEVSARGLPVAASLSLILLRQLAGEVIIRGLDLPPGNRVLQR